MDKYDVISIDNITECTKEFVLLKKEDDERFLGLEWSFFDEPTQALLEGAKRMEKPTKLHKCFLELKKEMEGIAEARDAERYDINIPIMWDDDGSIPEIEITIKYLCARGCCSDGYDVFYKKIKFCPFCGQDLELKK